MLAFYRIYTVIVRYAQQLLRDPGRIINVFYWPLFDVIIYGYMGIWTEQESATGIGIALLAGAMLSHIVIRANFDIAFNVIEECWSSNLVNMFASPLQFYEWILGLVCLAFMMFCGIVTLLWVLAYFFYGFNLLSIGFFLVPIVLNLFVFGLSIGFLSTSLLFYFGVRMQEVIFILGWLFDPFSGAYYPIKVLPLWMQFIARIVPLSYIFDALRSVVTSGAREWHSLLIGSLLNIVYLGAVMCLLKFLFRKSLEGGLALLSED